MEDFNNHITKFWSLKSLVILMFTLSGFVAACPIYSNVEKHQVQSVDRLQKQYSI